MGTEKSELKRKIEEVDDDDDEPVIKTSTMQ